MGWVDCGTDSKGRPIGYAFVATCDYPGCAAEIDRGLSYACGDMHGEDCEDGINSCEGYFCEEHLEYVFSKDGSFKHQLCLNCAKEAIKILKERGELEEWQTRDCL